MSKFTELKQKISMKNSVKYIAPLIISAGFLHPLNLMAQETCADIFSKLTADSVYNDYIKGGANPKSGSGPSENYNELANIKRVIRGGSWDDNSLNSILTQIENGNRKGQIDLLSILNKRGDQLILTDKQIDRLKAQGFRYKTISYTTGKRAPVEKEIAGQLPYLLILDNNKSVIMSQNNQYMITKLIKDEHGNLLSVPSIKQKMINLNANSDLTNAASDGTSVVTLHKSGQIRLWRVDESTNQLNRNPENQFMSRLNTMRDTPRDIALSEQFIFVGESRQGHLQIELVERSSLKKYDYSYDLKSSILSFEIAENLKFNSVFIDNGFLIAAYKNIDGSWVYKSLLDVNKIRIDTSKLNTEPSAEQQRYGLINFENVKPGDFTVSDITGEKVSVKITEPFGISNPIKWNQLKELLNHFEMDPQLKKIINSVSEGYDNTNASLSYNEIILLLKNLNTLSVSSNKEVQNKLQEIFPGHTKLDIYSLPTANQLKLSQDILKDNQKSNVLLMTSEVYSDGNDKSLSPSDYYQRRMVGYLINDGPYKGQMKHSYAYENARYSAIGFKLTRTQKVNFENSADSNGEVKIQPDGDQMQNSPDLTQEKPANKRVIRGGSWEK